MTEAELAQLFEDLDTLRADCSRADRKKRSADYEERLYGYGMAAVMVGILVFMMILAIVPGGWAQFWAILSGVTCPPGTSNFGC